MSNHRLLTASIILFTWCVSLGSAATFQEDFSTNPSTHGWQIFGDQSLFSWDSTNQDLRVTWDSSKTNSYFYHPLGTLLGRQDDFSMEFDLRLSDIATNAKSGPFEIAVGFLNFAEATSTNFERGIGLDLLQGPRDLVELDYFPAGYYAGFGDVAPSLSPTLISSDNVFSAGFDLFELTTNDLFHVALGYSSSNQTLHTIITKNGAAFGPIADVDLVTNFTDFRIDTISVSSYSDQGDDYDSVIAHGVIDNLRVTTPPAPVANVVGSWSGGHWQVQFSSQTNWLYTLEQTMDFHLWKPVSGTVPGDGASLALSDTNSPQNTAFYRIRAAKP